MNTIDDVIAFLLTTSIGECSRKELALLYEDALRACLVESLLDAGCRVRVGAHENKIDKILERAGGVTSWTRTPRGDRTGRFPDIYVQSPFAIVELKAFGEVGPKDYPVKPGCIDDLNKVVSGAAHAAIVVASQSAYDALQSNTDGYQLAASYPPRAAISSQELSSHNALTWAGHELVATAGKVRVQANGATVERVAVAVRLPAAAGQVVAPLPGDNQGAAT